MIRLWAFHIWIWLCSLYYTLGHSSERSRKIFPFWDMVCQVVIEFSLRVLFSGQLTKNQFYRVWHVWCESRCNFHQCSILWPCVHYSATRTFPLVFYISFQSKLTNLVDKNLSYCAPLSWHLVLVSWLMLCLELYKYSDRIAEKMRLLSLIKTNLDLLKAWTNSCERHL